MWIASLVEIRRKPSGYFPSKGASDGPPSPYPTQLALLEEAITTLFCLVDDLYATLNPKGQRYAALKRLTDSEVLTLALFQQLRGVEESERSFLREAARFFAHLFPGAWSVWLLPPPSIAERASSGATWSP